MYCYMAVRGLAGLAGLLCQGSFCDPFRPLFAASK